MWDPDFESKYGGNLSSNMNRSSNVDAVGRETVNVLVWTMNIDE
jgi:hypothetical protein